jgi:hypothetical protein
MQAYFPSFQVDFWVFSAGKRKEAKLAGLLKHPTQIIWYGVVT